MTYSNTLAQQKIIRDAYKIGTEAAKPARLPLGTTKAFLGHAVASEDVERSEVLTSKYDDEVNQRYSEITEVVSACIEKGKLAQEYELPSLTELSAEIKALSATYDAMQHNGWQPEVVFVPRGLGAEQWKGLLEGHTLLDTQVTSDNEDTKPKEITSSAPSYAADHEAMREAPLMREWDLVIMNGTDKPALVNTSRDGKHGPAAEQSLTTLSNLPEVEDLSSPKLALNQLSPNEDEYCALQWARLNRGLSPVDRRSWTFAKRTADKRVSLFNWAADHLAITTEFGGGAHESDPATTYSPVSGIRPVVRISDLT